MDNTFLITEKEYLMGRDKRSPLTPDMTTNMNTLLSRVNVVLTAYYTTTNAPRLIVSSGYRPEYINSNISNAAKNSKHRVCAAIDLLDNTGNFQKWVLKNLTILETNQLWLENPDSTIKLEDGPTPDSPKSIIRWCHLQIFGVPSGHRIFWP